MEARLADAPARTAYFQQQVIANIHYWQQWLAEYQSNVTFLHQERDRVVNAITFGLHHHEAWPTTYQLITEFSSYMERWGEWSTWGQVLQRAITAAQRVGDFVGGANLSVSLALMLQRQSRFPEAIHRYRRTLPLARQAGNVFAEARGCTNLGYIFAEQGYWHRSEILCKYALSLFNQIDSDYGRAHTENHLGILFTRQGQWQQAEKHFERACEIWEQMGDQYGLVRGFQNYSLVYLDTKQPAKALDYLQKALIHAQLTGEQTELGIIYMNMGLAYRLAGDLDQAEAYAKRGETIFEEFAYAQSLARVWNILGAIFMDCQAWDTALFYLEKSYQMWHQLGNHKGEIEVLTNIVECELTLDHRQQATRHLIEAEQLASHFHTNIKADDFISRLAACRRSLTE